MSQLEPDAGTTTTAGHDAPRWPSTPYALADTTRCPACFSAIGATETGAAPTTCTACGLSLVDGRLASVLRAGQDMLSLELHRRALIGAVRHDQRTAERAERAAAEAVTVTPAPTTPAPVAPPPVAPPPVAPPAVAAPPSPPQTPPPAPRRERPRISVPVLLLTIGVVLVGIAAIFFLTLAWFVASIAVRALIIDVITLATIVTASLLRRRGLVATAEAVAVVGIVLVALDAWAVRANDLFGAAGVDPVLYAGIATLGVGILFRAWARASTLRAPDIASILALPTGVALIAAGLSDLPTGPATVVAFLAASVGCLAFALPAPWSSAREESGAERTALALIGVTALVVAAATEFVAGDTAFVLWAVPLTVVAAGAWWRILTLRGDRIRGGIAGPLGAVAVCTGVAAAAAIGRQLALRDPSPWLWALLGPLVAVAVAVAVDRVRARAHLPVAALVTAGAIAALSLLVAIVAWLARVGPATADWVAWRTPAVRPAPDADAWVPLIAAVLLNLTLAASTTLRRRELRGILPATATVLFIAGAAVTGIPLVMVAGGALTAAGGVLLARRDGSPVSWGAPVGVGAAAMYVAGAAHPALWTGAAALVIVLPLALSRAIRARGAAQAAFAVVSVLLAALSAVVAPQAIATVLSGRGGDAGGTLLAAIALLGWVAAITLAICLALAARRPSSVEAATVRSLTLTGLLLATLSVLPLLLAAVPLLSPAAFSTGAGAGGAFASGAVSVAIGEPAAGLARAIVLCAALALLALGLPDRRREPQTADGVESVARPDGIRIFAAALLGPALATAVNALGQLAGGTDATPIVAVGALALLCGAAALAEYRTSPSGRRAASAVRTGADSGAAFATLLTATQARADLAWLVLLLIAVGIGATSITRGWAAPRSDALPGVPTTRSAGASLLAAPRRVLVWPAFAVATAALWTALTDAARSALAGGAAVPALEAYTVPPAVGLVVLALVLTWLRRHAEATVAGALAGVVGLGAAALGIVPGEVMPTASARTVVALLIGAVVCAALPWTPARRVPGVSLAATTTGLAAALLATLTLTLTASNASTSPAVASWTAVPVAAALLGASGFASGFATGFASGVTSGFATERRAGPHAVTAQREFAAIAPGVAIVFSSGICAAFLLGRELPLVATIALAALLVLSIVAAAVGRAPWNASTRWCALGGAALIAAVTAPRVDAIEILSLPVALTLLAGAALAMRRLSRTGSPWPGIETVPWLAGVTLAIVPSLLVPPTPVRSWLLVAACLLAAVGVAAVTPARTRDLAASTVGILLGGTVIAGWFGILSLSDPHGLAVGLVAGAGVAAVGAVLTWRRIPPVGLSVGAATAGAVVVALAVVTRGSGSIGETLLIAGLAGLGALVAATSLGRAGWMPTGAALAIGGVAVAIIAIGVRLVALAPIADAGLEPDVWFLAAALLVAAVALIALRANAATAPLVGIALATALAGVAFGEAWSIAAGDASLQTARAAVTVILLTAASVAASLCRERIGVVPAITGAISVAVVAVAALTVGAADPIEIVTVVPALGLLMLGVRRLRTDPAARTWPALGPGLLLATVPSLMLDFGPNELWRIVALGVAAVTLVVIGATRRLQAPLVVGSIVLLIHALAQLWPWVASAYDAVPWWLWVGLGGILLIVIAARYEKQLGALRAAYATVAGLR